MGNVLHRGKGSFTHVENTIFFDHGLSAKAKGIYCQIRSLEGNPEWVFTIKGFASLVRDGADAVTAGIKELEGAGYIIRARKRSENGRFLKAEEATWITLDDPAMHGEVCAELKADGFAILSEFERGGEPSAADGPEGPAKPPETRETGESPQVGARTGKPVSGKATSGKPAPINYSSDQSPQTDKQLISCDPAPADRSEEKASGDFREYRKGEFPEAFERLCSMSLKPLTSLAFKRDALKAWKAKVVAGFDPEQIVDAYAAYAKDYWLRNGDDNRLAKNLPRRAGRMGRRAHTARHLRRRRGAPGHGRPRPGGPGLREAVAQGADQAQRHPIAALHGRQPPSRGAGTRTVRRRRPVQALLGRLRGALCPLPQDVRPVRHERRGDGAAEGRAGLARIPAARKGVRMMKAVWRFLKWLFRSVFRFM